MGADLRLIKGASWKNCIRQIAPEVNGLHIAAEKNGAPFARRAIFEAGIRKRALQSGLMFRS
jgi:hypothetical protein